MLGVLTIAGVLTSPYWLAPLVSFATQRHPMTMALRLADEDELWAEPALFATLQRGAAALASEGYSPPEWFYVGEGAVKTMGALLEHPAEGTLATVAVMRTKALGPHSMTILESEWPDGAGVLTTNSNSPSAFPPVPRRDAMALPRVRDLATLARVHRARVARARPGEPPLRLTRGSDPIRVEQERQRRVRQHHVDIGYFRKSGANIRPTLRGAALMVWRLLPPWENVQLRDRDAREAALLAELGIVPRPAGER